jgi:hypothetical protein
MKTSEACNVELQTVGGREYSAFISGLNCGIHMEGLGELQKKQGR